MNKQFGFGSMGRNQSIFAIKPLTHTSWMCQLTDLLVFAPETQLQTYYQFVLGTGLNVAVACYIAMTFLLLPQGYYLSQVEINRGWQGVSITTHLEIWLSILTSLPFYTATLITWLMVEKECSPKCSQQPKTFRTNNNFESSEMILY